MSIGQLIHIRCFVSLIRYAVHRKLYAGLGESRISPGTGISKDKTVLEAIGLVRSNQSIY